MDELKATPRDPKVGLLADALMKVSGASGAVGEFLGLPAIARTAERASYGEPLTTGSGFATQLRPDTAEALLSLGPPAAKSPKTAFSALLGLAGSQGVGDMAAFGAKKGDLYSFATSLGNRVAQRVADSQVKTSMRDWAYQEGAQFLSQKTGNTLTILGKRVDSKDRPMYLVKAQHPDGSESTSFFEESKLLADTNLRPLNTLPADAESVQKLLKQIAK